MATTTITGNFADLLVTMHGALVATGKFENVTDVDENTFACKKNDELLYLAFQPIVNRYPITTAGNSAARTLVGMTIKTSSEWDAIGKAPAGTVQTLTLPFFTEADYSGAISNHPFHIWTATPENITDLYTRNYEMTYYCDEFGLYANIRNPYDLNDLQSASSSYPITCSGNLVILEFIPAVAREYNDGNPSMVGTVIPGPAPNTYLYTNNYIPVNYYARSFIYADRTQHYKSYRPAFKSTGNNKIYFEFPYYYNDPTAGYKSPIARTSRWFEVQKDESGLISGDIISWLDIDGVSVRKYLITEIASGDGTDPKLWAIPYDNAKPYTAS